MTIRPVLLILLACSLFAVCAQAQQVTPALALSSDPTSVQLGPNETKDVTITVRNTGNTAGQVTLRTSSVTAWSVQLSSTTFTVDGGTSRQVVLTVRTGADSEALRNVTVTVEGTVTYGANQAGTPGSTQVNLVYVRPLPPPIPPVPPSLVGPILGATGLIALVALGVYLFQAAAVRLRIQEPDQAVLQGSPATYQVEVENRARSARTVELRVRQLSAPWAAAFSFPTVKLSGREKTEVPLCVLPPIGAVAGESVRFRIEARPNRFSPWLVRRHIGSRVVVLPKPGPAEPVLVSA